MFAALSLLQFILLSARVCAKTKDPRFLTTIRDEQGKDFDSVKNMLRGLITKVAAGNLVGAVPGSGLRVRATSLRHAGTLFFFTSVFAAAFASSPLDDELGFTPSCSTAGYVGS